MSEVRINFMVIQVCSPLKESQEGVRQVSLEVVSGSRTPWWGSGATKTNKDEDSGAAGFSCFVCYSNQWVYQHAHLEFILFNTCFFFFLYSPIITGGHVKFYLQLKLGFSIDLYFVYLKKIKGESLSYWRLTFQLCDKNLISGTCVNQHFPISLWSGFKCGFSISGSS